MEKLFRDILFGISKMITKRYSISIDVSMKGELFIKLIPIVIMLNLPVSLAYHHYSTYLNTITVFSVIIFLKWIVEAAGVPAEHKNIESE
jgi:hypothetical protein